jgi:hypothetical protein
MLKARILQLELSLVPIGKSGQIQGLRFGYSPYEKFHCLHRKECWIRRLILKDRDEDNKTKVIEITYQPLGDTAILNNSALHSTETSCPNPSYSGPVYYSLRPRELDGPNSDRTSFGASPEFCNCLMDGLTLNLYCHDNTHAFIVFLCWTCQYTSV